MCWVKARNRKTSNCNRNPENETADDPLPPILGFREEDQNGKDDNNNEQKWNGKATRPSKLAEHKERRASGNDSRRKKTGYDVT